MSDTASPAQPATPAALPDWLRHQAATRPDRTGLVSGGRRWSFAALDEAVDALARRLAAAGIAPGDRIATLLHNGAVAAMLPHAALRLAATLVPLNVRLSAPEIAWQVRDAGPRLLLVEPRTAALAASASERQPVLHVDSLDGPDEAPVPSVPLRLVHPADHVAAIIYTSGTTGQPKGAMLTVANFWWSAIGSALNLGAREDDRWLAVLPLFHVGGLSIVMRSAIGGFAAMVHEGFEPDAVNGAIDDDGVTIVSVVAVMLQRMLDARGDRPYPASLRCVLLGGGPAPGALLERCARLGVPVVQTYGLTEATSQVATLPPADALRKLGAAGKAIYPNEVRIVDPAGRPLPDGEPGEIVVRGPVVTPGYAGRPADTARAIVDGWLHTGDVGRLDEQGYLHVLDRRDDLVITGGENVYPAEVEAVLLAHPAVAEAAVIGEPDDRWGQRVVAIVRLRGAGGAELVDALRAHCRTQLAGYKVPSEIRFSGDPLPRTASGKVQRGRLRG